MRRITVYRVDYARKLKVAIGSIIERRKTQRGNNLIGLLRLARKTYALSPEDALHIAIEAKECGRPRARIRPGCMTLAHDTDHGKGHHWVKNSQTESGSEGR